MKRVRAVQAPSPAAPPASSPISPISLAVQNLSHHELPRYQTSGAAAFDLTANLDAPMILEPQARALIPTGLHAAIPSGYELQIRPRSGLALKSGLTVLNAPGTIDCDYRGDIGVILINLSSSPYTVQDGDRIAQAVLTPTIRAEFNLVADLDRTARGQGGFGHTGS
jgi:dUTP pyrophosphatase